MMEPKDNYIAKHDKLVNYLGISVDACTPDYARCVMPLTPHHLNGMGVAHGGAIFTLVDAAFGAASNADRATGVVNLHTSIEYLLPGKKGPLLAEARAVRLGGHIASYTVHVFDADGVLIAHALISGYATKMSLPE